MLRGKRAVITGGGTGFGQALSVWLAREGVEVDFCARRADDIQKTCSIITAEGGMKWFTEFGHLNRGDMLTSEQHRCHNEKKKFQRR
ncbi:SDR family NAD(P)-dependent oxidoreductase, partial [Klebsiella pneumoniae]|uniref:SDR family NAD(P)-dependent oxidoreductase n=4 Tax=Klebsiella pneumoniae TaxID=573 RepID=UPI0039695691